jgi:hypothetical protein
MDLSLTGTAAALTAVEELRDWLHGREWVVGSDAKYAVYLELGTSQMPAYPFFEPAIKQFDADPNAFVERHANQSVDDADSVNEVTRLVAQSLEKQMKINAAAEQSGRSPGTHPSHPQVQSGNLRGSIKAEPL